MRIADTVTVLVMACALALPALLWSLQDALGVALARQSAGVVVLFLRDRATENHTRLTQLLNDAESVDRWEHLNARQSREAFMRYLGLDADTTSLESIAVPATTTLYLRSNAETRAIRELVRSLEQQSAISDIWWDEATRERDLGAYRLLRRIGYGLAFVLIGSGLAIIGGSIAGRMAKERPAITVMTLLGATDAFILRPHLVRVTAVSAVAALLSAIFLFLATSAARSALVPLESLWGVPLTLSSPSLSTVTGLLICAIGMGTGTAYLVVRQQLREIRMRSQG